MANDYTGRRPVSALETVHHGVLQSSPLKAQKDLERMRPDLNWGLGIAKVINIDYEELFVTLRTLTGASQVHDRVPVPLTFPGAGNRHFLGAIPEIGDYCIVGWQVQESQTEGTRTPVILAWAVPGVWPGREWLTTADFEIGEYDFEAPRDQNLVRGAHDRIRHKLRHAHPGNVVASSSQGADLVLDEGVTLANRRGNEIRLRDQDQAIVARSLQQFHAMAGARVYGGMVQRDALLLHPLVVSDGQLWDGPIQDIGGDPVSDSDLSSDVTAPDGFLTPARMFRKGSLSEDNGYLGRALLGTDGYVDPYSFLRWGGFINEAGLVVDERSTPDSVYGGKTIYRVAAQSLDNADLDPDKPTLTEYRVELTHTSDGRLPVTEQTDHLDAERLPRRDPETPNGKGLPANLPFIEWVMGSVIGNDPYTQEGRRKYGLPIRAVIFDGDQPVPRLEGASITLEGSGISPTPIGEQLASLFHVIPPLAIASPDTFWGVNKQGQLRASIGGDVKGNSVEAWINGGLKLGIGGEFNLMLNGHVSLGTNSKSSVNLSSTEGPVKIFGGGPMLDNSNTVERLSGSGRGSTDVPSVDIEAKTNARIKADRSIFLKGNAIEGNATSVNLTANQDMDLRGLKKVAITTDGFQKTVGSKAQETYSGPKYLLPTNGPLHERSYTPTYPGIVCEKVSYNQGDREETFLLGNHKTTVLVGNMSYTIGIGQWSVRASTSSLDMSVAGISGKAFAGAVTLTATAGVATMSGLTGANLIATGGPAQVRGSTGVFLGAPLAGPDAGPIICAGSLEPFTGMPFATWGLGAKNHLVIG